jgi:hypothetical protein
MSKSPVISAPGSPGDGKNLIINGGMDIWQRGTTFASTASTDYSADRVSGAFTTIDKSTDVPTDQGASFSFACTGPAGPNYLRTSWELPAAGDPGIMYLGRQMTLSFWVKGAVGEAINLITGFADDHQGLNGVTDQNGGLITASGAWEKVTFTWAVGVSPGVTNLCYRLLIGLGTTAFITNIQLEVGSSASDFEYKHITQIQNECYRYYWNSWPDPDQPNGRGLQSSTATFTDKLAQGAAVFFPVRLRAPPITCSFSNTENGNVTGDGQWSFYNGVAWEEADATEGTTVNGNSVTVRMERITTWAVDKAFIVAGNIAVDAEF